MNDRLRRWVALGEREAEQLAGVRQRLFGGRPTDAITTEWLQGQLADPTGIDRIESFGAKFSRMQDTLMDKLIPALLEAAGELPGTAIDNLDLLERLGLVQSADDWLSMRRLRNRLVHEYIDDVEQMTPAAKSAYEFSTVLLQTFQTLKDYLDGRRLLRPTQGEEESGP